MPTHKQHRRREIGWWQDLKHIDALGTVQKNANEMEGGRHLF